MTSYRRRHESPGLEVEGSTAGASGAGDLGACHNCAMGYSCSEHGLWLCLHCGKRPRPWVANTCDECWLGIVLVRKAINVKSAH